MSSLDSSKKFTSSVNTPPLNPEQFEEANKELNDQSFLKFPRIEKTYADPQLPSQIYCIHSFVPSKGATPDKNGLYGMVKFRGAFQSINEANERAEYLIRNVDSYNSILTGYVGRPFPLTDDNKKYCTETNEIDINKKTDEVISKDIKSKRDEEKRTIKEIQAKEKKLIEDVKEKDIENNPEDMLEHYTMLRVKRSQLIYTFNETVSKMNQMIKSLKSTEQQINKVDETNPEHKREYMERYNNARKECGLDKPEHFMEYLDKEQPYHELLNEIEF
jgi:hypothetical protein